LTHIFDYYLSVISNFVINKLAYPFTADAVNTTLSSTTNFKCIWMDG